MKPRKSHHQRQQRSDTQQQQPQRESRLTRMIAQGEHERQDFKYQISDAKKIARSISAFANHSGGQLLVGVKDNGSIVGVSSDEEIYMVEQAAEMYCKPPQKVEFELLRHAGKTVVLAKVNEAEEKPVKAPDENGNWKTYFRVKDENILASSTHVKVLDKSRETSAAVVYSEHDRLLLNYLQDHGGITLSGFAKLAHLSRKAAQDTVVALCKMNIVEITYHNGQCLVVQKE